MFDSCMQMKLQVNSVVKSCHNQIRNIGNIRKYWSLDAATNPIHAFISPRLDYANSLLTSIHETHLFIVCNAGNCKYSLYATLEITIRQYYITTTYLQSVHQISSSCLAAQELVTHTQVCMVSWGRGNGWL